MEVSSIMIKNVKSVLPGDNAKKIVDMMNRNKIGSVVVIEDHKARGIITERDILEKVVSKDKLPSKVLAKDIASKELVTVQPDDSVADAINLMVKNDIKKLVVVEDGELVGIVTASDILKSGEKIEYAVLEKLAKFLPVQPKNYAAA